MTLPRSLTPDQLRRDLKAIRDRLTEIERGSGTTVAATGLTAPVALSDLDATGAANGDVVTLTAGAWTYATPSAGGVISGFVNVTMDGDSGTATFTHASITTSTVITVAIASIVKSDHDGEDHMAEELQVYATNQIVGQVDITILSPNGGSFGVYQVNVIGV